MSLEAIVTHYGPLALVLGAAMEGETVAMIGGMVAHRGLMALPVAWAAVLVGTLVADQGLYFAGRRMRDRPFVGRLRGTTAFRKAQTRFERNPALFVLMFRFLYGLRTASPAMVGMSGFPPARFALLNLCAAIVWSMLFVGLGYAFGLSFEVLIGRVADFRDWLPWLLVPIAAGLVIHRLRRYRA